MKLLIYIMLTLPLCVFAAGDKPGESSTIRAKELVDTVELTLELKVYKVCKSMDCIMIHSPPSTLKISLRPHQSYCEEILGPCFPWSYVGRWSSVKVLDSVRYISIVTVEKNIISRDNENKPTGYNYSIKIEILGDDGVEAKAAFHNIEDINKLDEINLSTIEKDVRNEKYYATLFLGDKDDGSSTMPMPEPQLPTEPSLIENLTLIKGILL